MPGPVEAVLIAASCILAALSGFRWGKHAAQTMGRPDEESEGSQ